MTSKAVTRAQPYVVINTQFTEVLELMPSFKYASGLTEAPGSTHMLSTFLNWELTQYRHVSARWWTLPYPSAKCPQLPLNRCCSALSEPDPKYSQIKIYWSVNLAKDMESDSPPGNVNCMAWHIVHATPASTPGSSHQRNRNLSDTLSISQHNGAARLHLSQHMMCKK